MEIVPAGIPLTYEVTFYPDLDVGMSVYDTSGSSPVLVQGPTAMTLAVYGTYYGKFSATVNKSYVIVKAVYTDGSFTTIDSNFSQGSESIYATEGSGGGLSSVGCQVVGYVLPSPQIIGVVQC